MRVRSLLTTALLSGAIAVSLQGALRGQHAGHGTAEAGASKDLHAVMEKSHQKMRSDMKMTGDVDHDFATMMVMHHQSGIDMAEVEIAKGSDATMKAMAKKIIEGQQREIKELKAWLSKHKPAAR